MRSCDHIYAQLLHNRLLEAISTYLHIACLAVKVHPTIQDFAAVAEVVFQVFIRRLLMHAGYE